MAMITPSVLKSCNKDNETYNLGENWKTMKIDCMTEYWKDARLTENNVPIFVNLCYYVFIDTLKMVSIYVLFKTEEFNRLINIRTLWPLMKIHDFISHKCDSTEKSIESIQYYYVARLAQP